MIRSGVGLIVDRRFVERNVGRQTMMGTVTAAWWEL